MTEQRRRLLWWGVGASLTMESIPPHARGFVSGLLQSGYPTGYFLAAIVYGLALVLMHRKRLDAFLSSIENVRGQGT